MLNNYLSTIKSPQSRIPVWMMRQAGRYLPEYRKIRQHHSFLDMVYTPDVATEITLQPIHRFGFDAAILFSDILVTPQALVMELTFTEGKGPQFPNPIRTASDIKMLKQQMEILAPIYETVKKVKSELPSNTSLIGFAGAPFTVASYMIEGGTSKDLKNTKKMMLTNSDLFIELLDKVTDVTIEYLETQCHSGAQALQIFDTWINHLDWSSCQAYSSNYVKKIIDGLRARNIQVPITFFGKQTSLFYPLYESTGIDVISIDWNGHLGRIDQQLNKSLGLQGNLDPFVLYSDLKTIEKKVIEICDSLSPNRSFIFNLGHGLMPDIPIESVQCVIDTVRTFKRS